MVAYHSHLNIATGKGDICFMPDTDFVINMFLIFTASLSQQVATALSGHHLRKVAVEGSQVRLQCRLPMKSRRMMLMDEPVTIPVVWLRFDMKGK